MGGGTTGGGATGGSGVVGGGDGGGVSGAASRCGMGTSTSACSAGTSISFVQRTLPVAKAETLCFPGSIGSGVPSAGPLMVWSSSVMVSPGSGALTWRITRASFFSRVAICSRAKVSRSRCASRWAIAAADVYSAQAVAILPSFSWHTARLSSVPTLGSRRWLSASLGHA